MDFAEYERRLYSDIFTVLKGSRINPGEGISAYYEGHKPRFIAQIEMFAKLPAMKFVYDFGTTIPFTSYWFNLVHNAKVIFGSIDSRPWKVNELVEAININLNFPPEMPPADMVICTECLEHLPSNLYSVRAYLMSLVKRAGFLLLSFPCGGANAFGYERDNLGDKTRGYSAHIREFTEASAREFVKTIGFDIVAEKMTFTQAYGNQIWNVLMQRKL